MIARPVKILLFCDSLTHQDFSCLAYVTGTEANGNIVTLKISLVQSTRDCAFLRISLVVQRHKMIEGVSVYQFLSSKARETAPEGLERTFISFHVCREF